MPRNLDIGTVVLKRDGDRCLRVSEPCRGSGNCSIEDVGVMLLFLDERAHELYPFGRSSTRICKRSRISHRIYDLLRVPIAKDVPWEYAESMVRDILATAIEHIKAEAASELATASAPRTKRERRTRVFAPALSNGPVSVTIAA